jgi:hypothetical protein
MRPPRDGLPIRHDERWTGRCQPGVAGSATPQLRRAHRRAWRSCRMSPSEGERRTLHSGGRERQRRQGIPRKARFGWPDSLAGASQSGVCQASVGEPLLIGISRLNDKSQALSSTNRPSSLDLLLPLANAPRRAAMWPIAVIRSAASSDGSAAQGAGGECPLSGDPVSWGILSEDPRSILAAKERLDRPDGTRAFIAGYRRCRPSCRQA